GLAQDAGEEPMPAAEIDDEPGTRDVALDEREVGKERTPVDEEARAERRGAVPVDRTVERAARARARHLRNAPADRAVERGADERGGVDRGALRPGPARRGAAAHPAHAFLTRDAAHDAGDGRHEVHVSMRVPGERRDSPTAREGDLRADLGGELVRADASDREPAGELREGMEPSIVVAQARYGCRIGDGSAADEVEVEAGLEIVLGPGERGGLLGGRESDDERRGSDHAAAVRFEDALRHAGREPEVVCGDDERHARYSPRSALMRMRNRSRNIRGASLRKSTLVSRR